MLGGNPFAARPGLKSDVVSTAGPNQSVGPSNQAKFVLRPSALSSLPHNSAEQGKSLTHLSLQGSHTPFWEWGRGPLNLEN